MAKRFQRTEGHYSLTAEPDEHGFYHLFKYAGTANEFDAGLVADPENFEFAVDEADEESRVLLADARKEFGY